jgi:hypothetical protein
MSHSRSDSFTMKAGTDDKKKTDGGETGLVLSTDLRLSVGWRGCSTFVGRQRTTGGAGERRSASGRAAAAGGGGRAAAEMPMAIFRRGTQRCSGDWTEIGRMGLINWTATSHATWTATTAGRLAARNLTRQWRGRRSRVAAGMRQRGMGSSWGNGFHF